MANPLFNALGGNNMGANMPVPLNNVSNIMNAFQNFRKNFTGNPKQKVQELLNSGEMSQDQYNQLQNMAKQFMKIMPR